MEALKLETKNYEGIIFFGINFKDHPETIYLKSDDLRKKAIKNYNAGKIARSYNKDHFKGLPFYTELNY